MQGRYPNFLAGLSSLLGDTAKSEEEIRLALGVEKRQLKGWLIDAIKDGFFEKQKKPVRYMLQRQQSFC